VHDSATLNAAGFERGIYRVAPAKYLYRIEAMTPGTMVAGRASRWIAADRDTLTGFGVRGFGMSDLLLASVVQPNQTAPQRWRDFNIVPLLGTIPKQATLEILWENYELSARDGQSRYTVAVTLQRQRSRAGRIAAELLGFAASAVGISRRDDRTTFTFERTSPPAPAAVVDHVAIAMRGTPAGDYRVTLEITDRASGRKASSVSAITIHD